MTPQSAIAHYRLTTKLGEGGMGAVYRATDTKLHREVAIKVLPDSFAADPDRLLRTFRPSGGRQERPEALAAGQVHQLPVAAEHRDAGLDRPERAGRDDETRPLADRERARPGEEVEGDRDRHRRRDADGDRPEEGPVGPPVPVVEGRRQEHGDRPADATGDQRGAPAAADAEQTERQRGRHDRDDEHDEHAKQDADDGDRDDHRDPPVHGAPAPHNERWSDRLTSATRARRGWNASALSASARSEPVSTPCRSKS